VQVGVEYRGDNVESIVASVLLLLFSGGCAIDGTALWEGWVHVCWWWPAAGVMGCCNMVC